MKKILLFICMVMCAVGAKAYNEYEKDLTTYKYNYASGTITYFLSHYEILVAHGISSPGNHTITATHMYCITDGNGTSLSELGNGYRNNVDNFRYARNPEYSAYVYYMNSSKRNGTSTNLTQSNAFTYNQSNYYTYGFNIHFDCKDATNHRVAQTYIVYGYVQVDGGDVYWFKKRFEPNFTTYNSLYGSNKTIDWTNTYDLSKGVSSQSISTTVTYTCTSAKTFSNSDITGYSISSSTISNLKPGTYTIQCKQSDIWTSSEQRKGMTNSYTLTVNKKPTTLVYNNKTLNLKQTSVIDLNDCFASSNSNGTRGYRPYSSLDGASLNNEKLIITKPGTFTIMAFQNTTDEYAYKEVSFTVTVPAQKLKKVRSCMTNDYHMSEWYDGATAKTWTGNTPNLRYVNSNSMQSSETFMLGGLTELSGNHTVVKYSDAVETPITSTRMLIDANNKVVSTNPTFTDADKYDYVVPGNADISFLTKPASAKSGAKSTSSFMSATDASSETQKVTFTRTQGLPEGSHYGTICLPFSVPEGCMPAGFTFEGHVNLNGDYVQNGMLFLKFTPVTSLEAGVPYIFKRTDASKEELKIEVPASQTTFVAHPSYSDAHFIGSFINLITEDLHCETASNPYNNGSTSVSIGELDDYFTKIKDANRVAYFIKPAGDTDHIKLATNNVSVRPFRAFFRLNTSDFTNPNQSSGSAKPTDVVFIEHEGDDYATSVREFTPTTYESSQLDVYDVHGRKVASDVDEEDPTDGLQPGIYILSNGKKVLKK